MSRKTIYIVIILGVFSLAGIVITQIFWVNKAYSIEKKQFDDRVVIAMSSVVERILTINDDSSLVEPVKQLSSNFFVANINDTLHPYLLEALLRDEFTNSNLKEDFEYGIYDCFNDSIVFGSKLNFSEDDHLVEAENVSIQKRFDKDGHYFGIYFPKKTNIIIKQMDFWVFSSLIIFLVVLFFAYSILIILKQKRLSEVKTDFINNMTHELKTPISTIALSSEVLLNPKIIEQPERLNQYAHIIQNENFRLKTQVDRVLQIATLSPDHVKLNKQEINMHEIIQKAVDTFKVRTDEQDGVIKCNLKAKQFNIEGDLVHITNIIYNLLDNACKYTEKKPEIEISSSNKKEWFELVIKDNGIGIEQKYLKMIFDKFFRVPKGNIHDVKGFGLGLYYVKSIVRAHDGTIDVTSEIQSGSEFRIRLKSKL